MYLSSTSKFRLHLPTQPPTERHPLSLICILRVCDIEQLFIIQTLNDCGFFFLSFSHPRCYEKQITGELNL